MSHSIFERPLVRQFMVGTTKMYRQNAQKKTHHLKTQYTIYMENGNAIMYVLTKCNNRHENCGCWFLRQDFGIFLVPQHYVWKSALW